MTAVKSQDLKKGQLLVNLGIIEEVELFIAPGLTRVVIRNGNCISAAFYWFYYDVKLYIA